MIDELKLFRGNDFKLNEHITIHHPTLNEICDYGEFEYYSMVFMFCATTSDYKVQLYDKKILYTDIDDFECFRMRVGNFKQKTTSILFGDTDFSKLYATEHLETKELCLINPETGFLLNKTVYTMMSNIIRSIHSLEKRVDKAGNKSTLRALIDMERREQEWSKKNEKKSVLIPLISSMVNCENFKYNHKTVWELPIYVFNDSVKRIQKIKNFDSLMYGVYSGSIDSSKLNLNDLYWTS